MTIIETSANQLYRVRETESPGLDHVWWGVAVKRSGNTFVDKKNAREELVRKVGSTIVQM